MNVKYCEFLLLPFPFGDRMNARFMMPFYSYAQFDRLLIHLIMPHVHHAFQASHHFHAWYRIYIHHFIIHTRAAHLFAFRSFVGSSMCIHIEII